MRTYNYNYLTGNGVDENNEEFTLIGLFSLVDGNQVYIFDTKEDRESFINSKIPSWDKAMYSEELNAAHKALFRKYYYDVLPPEERYESVGEISLWLDDEEYSEEAQALSNWWRVTCKQIIDYLDGITEETAIDVETYINSLSTPFDNI
jgi:hypothetical protein